MRWTLAVMIGAIAIAIARPSSADTTLTIATVNNGDMIRMQKLTDDFKKRNPGIDLEWVTLEENVLREKVTTDIATKAGQYDVLTIGTYEVPIWAKQGWLVPLSLGADYDVGDPPAADPQRSVGRRQALRRAVLRRKLDADVPQGPVREGGPHDARKAHLGLYQDRS